MGCPWQSTDTVGRTGSWCQEGLVRHWGAPGRAGERDREAGPLRKQMAAFRKMGFNAFRDIPPTSSPVLLQAEPLCSGPVRSLAALPESSTPGYDKGCSSLPTTQVGIPAPMCFGNWDAEMNRELLGHRGCSWPRLPGAVGSCWGAQVATGPMGQPARKK